MVKDADHDLLARFEGYLVRLGLSPATVVNYLADMRGVACWCAESGRGYSLLSLTPDDVRAAVLAYARQAREAGHSWREIGEAVGLSSR